MSLVESEGAPEYVQEIVRTFAVHAPEVLALGPVPAMFAARLLDGLCSSRPEVRRSFLLTMARESAPPSSPTVASMLRAGLIARTDEGVVDIADRGRRLYELLVAQGLVPTDGQRKG